MPPGAVKAANKGASFASTLKGNSFASLTLSEAEPEALALAQEGEGSSSKKGDAGRRCAGRDWCVKGRQIDRGVDRAPCLPLPARGDSCGEAGTSGRKAHNGEKPKLPLVWLDLEMTGARMGTGWAHAASWVHPGCRTCVLPRLCTRGNGSPLRACRCLLQVPAAPGLAHAAS